MINLTNETLPVATLLVCVLDAALLTFLGTIWLIDRADSQSTDSSATDADTL